jgi:hypothetical protein
LPKILVTELEYDSNRHPFGSDLEILGICDDL